MAVKKYSLPKRLNIALSAKAYRKLRELNETYQYGNNYLLTVLLEHIDDITEEETVEKVFAEFREKYSAPAAGGMKTGKQAQQEGG